MQRHGTKPSPCPKEASRANRNRGFLNPSLLVLVLGLLFTIPVICSAWNNSLPSHHLSDTMTSRYPTRSAVKEGRGMSTTSLDDASASSTTSALHATQAPTAHRVVTYNVLSSHLSGASHFASCSPEHLDPKTRLTKVLAKLTTEIDAKAIICLQEVSTLWAGALHPFFAAADYHMVTGLYGGRFNGYMGIAIAFPKDRYVLQEADITRVADTKRLVKGPKLSTLQQIWGRFQAWMTSWAITLRLHTPMVDMWDNALYRTNQLISLRLVDRRTSERFVVATYHMPCMFKLPSVMVTHCALSAQHVMRWAGNDAYVYTGDFNIKPMSSMYELLTQGTLDEKHPDYPTLVDEWRPNLTTPLRSAYFLANGQEPDFTNYAQVQQDPVFIETLDYIFLSKHWAVQGVQQLPERAMVQGPLPNAEEPSDHILIAAELTLQEVKEGGQE